MKKLNLLLLAFGMLFSTLSIAQVSFGVEAGANFSNVSFDVDDAYAAEDRDNVIKVGYHVGLVSEFDILDILSIQPGLIFTNKGYKEDFEKTLNNRPLIEVDDYEGHVTTSLNYLEIPVNVALKFNGLEISAGPYLAIGVGGKFDYDIEYKIADVPFEDDLVLSTRPTKLKPAFGKVDDSKLDDLGDDEIYYNALDYGFNFGLGYQYGNIGFKVGYSLGLANITPDYDDTNDIYYNSNFTDNVDLKNNVITASLRFYLN